ncbi:Man1-Src1p-C-terminal domain-containing protein [Kalaharituber pfeilii]|nr:Man1-Src1p-C-terminal domain-containing protein [Kalaharituber pfeilii]
MDDDTYLQPDFDPNTVTIPVLRNILFRNDVELPNTAKKAQLVELFNEHIAPRRAAILDQRSRVRASSHGIVDVDKHGNAVQDDSRRRRTGRRKSVVDGDDGAAAAATVGDEEILDSIIMSPPVRTAPRGPSPAKKVSSRFTRTEDAGPAAPSTSRKSRRSSSRPAPAVPETPAPKQQEEEPDQQAVNGEPEQSPFSSENPFQRGTPVRRSPKENRRKSTPRSGLPTEERQSSRSTRRQTDFISSSTRDHDESSTSTSVITDRRLTGGPYDTLHSSTQRYEIPLSRLRNPSPVRIKQERHDEDDEEDLLRPGEEFTPEEAQEVAEAERESTAVARARRRTVGGEGPGPASMLWVIMGTLLSAYFVWWRKEKIDIGYCGVGMTDTSPWTNILRPSCEPCPPNAICKPKYVAVCKDDYVLLHNPLSLGGLIPLPPTCEPDSEKLRRIAILSDEAIKVLRKRAAEVECGEVEPTKVRLQKKKKVVEKGQGGAEGRKREKWGRGRKRRRRRRKRDQWRRERAWMRVN